MCIRLIHGGQPKAEEASSMHDILYFLSPFLFFLSPHLWTKGEHSVMLSFVGCFLLLANRKSKQLATQPTLNGVRSAPRLQHRIIHTHHLFTKPSWTQYLAFQKDITNFFLFFSSTPFL
jgi:hypothetical protein